MPTPVSTARQCLTPEAAHALDEAVCVARRRGHGQTTSLHAVSALLSPPSSALREACARARNSAYSPRLQFKALELCLSVSLDRVPAGGGGGGGGGGGDDPPVSNSLMAAIKRSQANQRRQPESFQLYPLTSQQLLQQPPSSPSNSITCVKVELRNLILSILDDPVVSRVFGEAGFRSSEIKLAIIRPLHQVFKFPRFKAPPLFLSNLTDGPDFPGRAGFSFPFSGYTGFFNGDESFGRRVGEVLVRSKGRNPLLVGASAYDTLASFCEMIEKRRDSSILPSELSGMSLACVESDLRKFLGGDCERENIDLRFQEVGQLLLEKNMGCGLLVNFGDLEVFVSKTDIDNNVNDKNNVGCGNGVSESVAYVVQKLTRLLQLHDRKVWLIGAAASYETYDKFVSKFPSIVKDWDLQLLPITSLKTSMAESFPRSSLMESFVPFGGFFSTPSDLNSPLSSSYQGKTRCHQCNEKCQQEVLAVSQGGFAASVADHYQSSLPSWLQMTELGTNKAVDVKTRDDGVISSTRVAGLQRKWDRICQRLHHSQTPRSNIHPSQFPTVLGFQLVDGKKENAGHCNIKDTSPVSNGNQCANANSYVSIMSQKISGEQLGVAFPVISEAKTESILSKQLEKPSEEEDIESHGLRSPCNFSSSSIGNTSRASPTSVTSVTADLGLRISSVSPSNEMRRPVNEHHKMPSEELSGSYLANVDTINGNISDHRAQSSSSSCPNHGRRFDSSDLKMLFRALVEKVSWQDEAIGAISQTIASHCGERNKKRQGVSLRGDIWLHFQGPDSCGKKKVAVALAEKIYGNKENFIYADLGPQLFDCQLVNGYDVMFRGKTLVDYVAAELCKKPFSVVFLENIDKADVQAQNSLSHAIRSGKFLDSHGREVRISNAIFATTSTFMEHQPLSSRKGFYLYSEEKILRTKGRPIQVLIEHAPGGKICADLTLSVPTSKEISSSICMNKRKLLGGNQNLEPHEISEMVKRVHKTSTRGLDLNLPAEENEVQETDDGNSNNIVSVNSGSWLEDFVEQVDRKVVFKPFDFDALAETLSNEINKSFHKIVGSDCLLEIDPKVMEQLLAAAYLSDRSTVVEDWVEQVLNWGFVEVLKRYHLSPHSVVKLVACDGLFLEEHIPGVYLPSKIILN